MIEFSGVRSSWLMLARKRVFSCVRCSAASRSRSRRWIWSSMSLKPSQSAPISSSARLVARSEVSPVSVTRWVVRASSRIGPEMTRCSR